MEITHKRRFSFRYWGVQDYLYLTCGIKLNVSEANNTFCKLKKLQKQPSAFDFKFDLCKTSYLMADPF